MSKFMCRQIVNNAMIQDLGREFVEAEIERDGRRLASQQGAILPEEFATAREPVAWVEDWTDAGGDFVDPVHAALVLGRPVSPTHEIITLTWRATRPPA